MRAKVYMIDREPINRTCAGICSSSRLRMGSAICRTCRSCRVCRRCCVLARETLKPLDPTRGVAKISFTGAAAERLGAAGEGVHLTEAVMDRAAVLLAFEQV